MNFFFSSRRRHTFFFQAEDGIRDRSPSRGLGDVYKRQGEGNGGGAGLAAWMARARWRVSAPCPVPASKISSWGEVDEEEGPGTVGLRSRRETIRFASAG